MLEPSVSSEPAKQSFTVMNVSQFQYILVCTESESVANCFFDLLFLRETGKMSGEKRRIQKTSVTLGDSVHV